MSNMTVGRWHSRKWRAFLVPLLALLLSALLPPLVAGASSAQVVRVTFDADRDAETSVAVNPNNPSNVVAGWISSGDRTCGYGVSFDGGLTWGAPVVAMTGEDSPSNSISKFEDHQFLTANPANGHLYLTQTEFTAFGKPAILFTRSSDGGRTWAEPVQINDRAGNATFQEPFSAPGKYPKVVYVTFGAFSNAGLPNWDRIYIAKSSDGGLTFSQPQLL